jgi:hypothetical protein
MCAKVQYYWQEWDPDAIGIADGHKRFSIAKQEY